MPNEQAKIVPEEQDLLARAITGDEAAVRTIIRQNNRRLFRLARSIVRDDAEAEDIVQETYFRAFTRMADFRGESLFSTWLTRILLNEAYGRLRRRRLITALDEFAHGHTEDAQIIPFPLAAPQPDPERAMAQHEISLILERAIDALPDPFRVVFVARLVEEMSVEDTAGLLGLRPETVKTRLHRARLLLRKDLEQRIGPVLTRVFPFGGVQCDRIADAVLNRLTQAVRSGNL